MMETLSDEIGFNEYECKMMETLSDHIEYGDIHDIETASIIGREPLSIDFEAVKSFIEQLKAELGNAVWMTKNWKSDTIHNIIDKLAGDKLI